MTIDGEPTILDALGKRLTLLLTAIVFANAPFWLLGQRYAIERDQFNVDFLLAISVMACRPAPGLLLLGLFWCSDGVVSQSMTYHFNTALAFLDSARFAPDVNLSNLASPKILLSLLFFGAAMWILARLSRLRRPEWGMTVLAFGVLFLLDTLNGSSRYALGDQRLVAMNIAGSPVITMARQYMEAQRHDPPVSLKPGESVAQTAQLLEWAQRHPSQSIWLILVESMGWQQSDVLRAYVASSLNTMEVTESYTIEVQRMPFKGATTSGELRALCNVTGKYADLVPAQAENCLPAALGRMGWATTGLHGFTGRMFDRLSWWPTLGFQTTLFQEDMTSTLPLCGGAFRGICDGALLTHSAEQLRLPRQFVYSLTLNTHLPLDPAPVPTALHKVCDAAGVSDAVCELTAAHAAVLSKIATLAGTVSTAQPLIVVLGDHAPPFIDKRSRAAYDSNTVPAFILRPR